MDAAGTALVPPWLESLLTTSFFKPCREHCDAAKSECNMFCLDCPSDKSFCFYCRSAFHSDHCTIQIRRSSYHDVVRMAEIQKLLDIGGVQTYVINSARVLFLNERPQPRGGGGGGGASTSSTANSVVSTKHFSNGGSINGAPHICEVCSRTLLDPFRFCSLGCKLERIKRNGDACFVLDEDYDYQDERDEDSGVVRSTPEGRRRRRRRGRAVVGIVGGDVVGSYLSSSPSTNASTTSATTSSSVSGRRRKGIPHRAPLAS